MYIDVEWKQYPKEKPFTFPGKTPLYVTIRDPKTELTCSKVSLWDHWREEFEDSCVIAWAYIPDAHCFRGE